MTAVDLTVSFPARGVIRLESRSLFGDAANPDCRRLIERVLLAPEITGITVHGGHSPRAELHFRPAASRPDRVVERIVGLLRRRPEGLATSTNGRAPAVVVAARGRDGAVRYFRRESVATGWTIQLDRPGRLRLKNRALYRKARLCHAIERALGGVLGIEQYRTSALTGTVHVDYDPTQLGKPQVIEILGAALDGVEHPEQLDRLDLHLPICTASLPIAATAQFAAPALLPVAAAVFAYTSIPTFREAYRVLFRERRLGVEVLDPVVVLGCLGTMAIFPGAVLCWCLGLGRVLVKRTQDNSRKLLLGAFGQQPLRARLLVDGTEARVPLDRLRAGDLVVVGPGEVVPVDGHIVEGMAMIDRRAMTGESTPAEMGVGDRVFASTLLIAGEIYVSVEAAGGETASAGIGRILDRAAGYKLSAQQEVERLADRAVIPALALGAVGMATMGPGGALAVLKCDFGSGIRMAAPLAMLSSLALCAHRGILVKDGRALELMNEVDTVLIDQAATLTRERPEVGRIVAAEGFTEERILLLAAAAERRFHHPIALAILDKAEGLGLGLPAAEDTRYKVGSGIIARVEGHTVRIGSRPFLEAGGIEPTREVSDALDEARRRGETTVMVGVDNRLGGVIQLRAAVRSEVREVVDGLRRRGIPHVAILADDKADHVERLRKEGRTVCCVGVGINDSSAMERANVSVSIRGASSIATDPAHIVFLEEGLAKLCDLRDIARDLDRNVKRSRSMILAPNIACIAGVFTMGFGILASVVTNQLAALAALGNGVIPLREVAQLEAERRHRLQISRTVAAGRAHPGPMGPTPEAAPHPAPPEDPVPAAGVPQAPPSSGRETLYRRPLRKPIEAGAREAISDEFSRRRREWPMAAELLWHREEPRFTISANGLSFIVHLTRGDLVVDAEVSPAARAFATPKHRDQAVRFIESLACDLGL